MCAGCILSPVRPRCPFEMLWVQINHLLVVWASVPADDRACKSFLPRGMINAVNQPHIFSGFKFSELQMSQSRQPKSFLSWFWILSSFRSCPLPVGWIFPTLSCWEGSYLEYDRACYYQCAKQRVVALPASSLYWKGGMIRGPATRNIEYSKQVPAWIY